MTRRLYLAQNRMVISLPGYEAGPATPFEGVSFDSDTAFGGLILSRGVVVDTSPIADDNPLRTNDVLFDMPCPNLRPGYSTILFLTYTSPDLIDDRQGIRPQLLMEASYLDPLTLRIKRTRNVGDTYSRFVEFNGNDMYFMVLAS
ncbi:hypothetical protein [Jiella pacifica]|uniref:Uncharacterized protein n=1 Tax=Jiella pacifica TaxID=2696469 RepID=A0A6N9SZ40_9HYPH|nr:hypothetical protein [Jiella pacifica]NDW04081.1 hypothetical protein [Jiella pacifica]